MQEALKELLGEELVTAIGEITDIDKIVSTDKGEYVPRDVMNKEVDKHKTNLQAEIDSLTTQLETRTKDLAELEKTAADGKEAQAKITELTEKYKGQDEAHQKDMLKVRMEADIKLALVEAGAKPHLVKAMMLEIDTEQIRENNGKFEGIDTQVTALKEGDFKEDFGQVRLSGKPPIDGKPPDATKNKVEMDSLEKQWKESGEKGDLKSQMLLRNKMEKLKQES